MKFEKADNNITIFFSGKIDSSTTPSISTEVNYLLSSCSSDFSVVFDFADVSYISSVGLRMLLGVKQKYCNFTIINVSLEVYEVFEMTGFTDMIKIQKRIREISVEGLEKIGEGAVGIIYRLSEDSIVKVIKYAFSMEDIKREIDVTKKAFILGIPTRISFDVVKVGDRFGLVFELLNSKSLGKQIIANPDKLDYFISLMAELINKIESVAVPDGYFPSAIDNFLNKLEKCRVYLSDSEYSKFRSMLSGLMVKNILVHGDCHIKNIMTQDGQPVLIDLDAMSIGNPIMEYSALCVAYRLYSETEPGNSMSFFGISDEASLKIYNGIMKINFGYKPDFKEICDKVLLLASLEIICNVIEYENGDNALRIENALKHIRKLLPIYDNLDIV